MPQAEEGAAISGIKAIQAYTLESLNFNFSRKLGFDISNDIHIRV